MEHAGVIGSTRAGNGNVFHDVEIHVVAHVAFRAFAEVDSPKGNTP